MGFIMRAMFIVANHMHWARKCWSGLRCGLSKGYYFTRKLCSWTGQDVHLVIILATKPDSGLTLEYIRQVNLEISLAFFFCRLSEVRIRLYELLTHCIPADVIMKVFAQDLFAASLWAIIPSQIGFIDYYNLNLTALDIFLQFIP